MEWSLTVLKDEARQLVNIRVTLVLSGSFPKMRGTILGVPIIRTIVFWGLYWGPLILGDYHLDF